MYAREKGFARGCKWGKKRFGVKVRDIRD